MNRVALHFVCGAMSLAVGLGATCSVRAAELAVAVWEMSPYKVQVWVALGQSPQLSPALAADLRADLEHRISTTIGPMWDASVIAAPPDVRREVLAGNDSPSVDTLPKAALQFDKIILLAVLPDTTGYRLRARELDVRTQTWNTPAVRRLGHPAGLLDAALTVVRESFAPLGLIATADRRSAHLRLRASALASDSKALAPVKPGDLFRPVIRKNDREGKLSGLTTIPFTFFLVDKISTRDVQCKIHSGMRNPMSEKRRGRIEQLAIGIRPPQQPTVLTLQSRADPKQTLAGYDVFVTPPGSTVSRLLARSDRQGKLVVPPSTPPLQILVVKSGDQALARLPIVPGLAAQLSAPVANDDQRLAAEGFVAGWQEELVDLVTRREVLLIQARARLEEKKIDAAAKLLDQIKSLKTREVFSRELADAQRKTVSNDTGIQKKIDLLFSDTQKLLQQHLDPAPVEKLAEEVRLAKAAPPPAKPASPPTASAASPATAPVSPAPAAVPPAAPATPAPGVPATATSASVAPVVASPGAPAPAGTSAPPPPGPLPGAVTPVTPNGPPPANPVPPP